MPKSWYKKNIDKALEQYLSSDDSGNVVTAIASPIYPSNSAQDVRKKNDGSKISEVVRNQFNQKFPFSQLASGNGACYFNASFAAILHDCVGDVAKWKKFRQGLENLFGGASFAEGVQIADFIAQIDEGMEFPTREKVNEVLGVIGDDNIVTKMSKTLLVDIYGQQFVNASKEYLVGEAATYNLKWNGTSGGDHQQQWNNLIDEYVDLRERDEITFAAGERQRLTEALDVRKNTLIKGIMSETDSLDDFWTNVVDENSRSEEDSWMLEYGLQNLRLYEAALDKNTLAETYDGNQMKPFFDMLYPGVEIVAITNNGMERSMNTDRHPKVDTIYLYNPDGRSHFSVLHADLDGRIAADIAREETVALPRNSYVTDVASVPLPRPNSDAFTFTAEQVKAAVKNSRINEANEYKDPIAYAIDNFDSEIIWALAVERASNHPYDQDSNISAIQGKIDSLDAINQSVEIESLKSLVDYMLQVNASLEPKSLQMGAKLRAQSAPSSILLVGDEIEEFPKKVDGEKPVELSLKDLEKEMIVLSKVIAEKTPAPKTANPKPATSKPATSKPKAKKSSTKFSNEEIRGEFDKYLREESKKEVSERQIGEGLRTKVKAIAESGTEFLVKEGGDGQAISAKEAAKEKLRDFAGKHVDYKEGTNKSDFLDKLAEFSAVGVAVKAIKSRFNDKVEEKFGKTEIDQKAFAKTSKDHQRHMRISFQDVDFSSAYLNSFANCEFDGACKFDNLAFGKNKFVNCTFGESCTVEQAKELVKLGADNLSACKFSPKFIEKLGGETERQKFKEALKIEGDLVGGYYQNSAKKPSPELNSAKKPSPEFAPIAAFKVKEMQLGKSK